MLGRNHSENVPDRPALAAGSRLILGDIELEAPDDLEPERRTVESFVSAVLQSEHLNLLVGSGLTTALANAAGGTASADMTGRLTTSDDDLDSAIEEAAIKSARFRSG